VHGEAKPESRAKEVVRGQMRNLSGGEKHAHDGPDGSYRQPYSKRPDHPFPVQGNVSPADRQEGFDQGKQKEDRE